MLLDLARRDLIDADANGKIVALDGAQPERELRGRLQDILLAGREPTEQETLLIGLLEPLELIASTGDMRCG